MLFISSFKFELLSSVHLFQSERYSLEQVFQKNKIKNKNKQIS